jgi:hypothetical protein
LTWLRNYFQVDLLSAPDSINKWQIKIYLLSRPKEGCIYEDTDENINLLLLKAAQALYEKYEEV